MTKPLDPCCPRCRTPWGVCATKRTCDHHQDASREETRRDAVATLEADLRRAAAISTERTRR